MEKAVPADTTLYIGSDDEDEELSAEVEDSASTSDSSDHSTTNQEQSEPDFYSTSWPQSYRQSIDLYSNIQSPSIGLLGAPTFLKLGSSFITSSLSRRRNPEVLPSLVKPLLGDSQLQKPPTSSSKLALKDNGDQEPSKVFDESLMPRKSSYLQAVLNGKCKIIPCHLLLEFYAGMNAFCGVGILSTPYAAKEGGWLSISIIFFFGIFCFYTGILLRCCLDSKPGLKTFPDIGQAAFGTVGRFVIAIILYVELYASCVEIIILESDNLSSLFPNAHLSVGGFELNPHHLFALIATLAVLPTVWLRDLSVLSYISGGGVIASILVVVCLFWFGLVDQVGSYNKGATVNLTTLPVAIGLYGFCFSGHSVLPNIYTSMAKPSQYPLVLLTCFIICTVMYAGVAVMGYFFFGESMESQFTLNMPKHLTESKIALWTTVVNPFTQYALTMTPVATSLEEFMPSNNLKSRLFSVLVKTTLVISTLIVALAVPFFGLVMALTGSLLAMLVSLILPCLCYLRILKGKVTRFQGSVCVLIISVGTVAACVGTYSAMSKIIKNLN